jgi:hypothetical protein
MSNFIPVSNAYIGQIVRPGTAVPVGMTPGAASIPLVSVPLAPQSIPSANATEAVTTEPNEIPEVEMLPETAEPEEVVPVDVDTPNDSSKTREGSQVNTQAVVQGDANDVQDSALSATQPGPCDETASNSDDRSSADTANPHPNEASANASQSNPLPERQVSLTEFNELIERLESAERKICELKGEFSELKAANFKICEMEGKISTIMERLEAQAKE